MGKLTGYDKDGKIISCFNSESIQVIDVFRRDKKTSQVIFSAQEVGKKPITLCFYRGQFNL